MGLEKIKKAGTDILVKIGFFPPDEDDEYKGDDYSSNSPSGGNKSRTITQESTNQNQNGKGNDDIVMIEEGSGRDNGGKVVGFPNGNQKTQVVISEPTSFKDVQALSDQLRDHKQVIINLENTPRENSQRIIDFLCGTVHAINGQRQQIGKYIFVFTPQNMEINKGERTDGRRGTGAGYFMNVAAPAEEEK